MRVKKLITLGLSEGGDVQLDFLLKSGGAYHECYCKKNNVLACVISAIVCFLLQSFGGGGNRG